MISIPSKLPQVGTTIFSVMSQMANEHKAINLSQGFPDFDCDPELVALLGQFSQDGFNQYAPMIGWPQLRQQIAFKYKTCYKVEYHSDSEITISAGASQAIFSILTACIAPGDEVIVFEPSYDLYQPTVQLLGGVVKSIVLKPPYFKIDWDEVKDTISPKTKMLILNNPNNPATKLLKKEDLEILEALLQDTSILVLSDEVYEHIVFDDEQFQSVCLYPGLKERSFIVASFGKLLHITGWKIGYCVAPVHLMTEYRKAHQFNVFCVHTPSQMAIAAYLSQHDVYQELSSFFERKRDLFMAGMSGSKFDLIPSEGTYFINATYAQISSLSDFEFASKLVKDYGVAAIPVSAFYTQQKEEVSLLRFCFAKRDSTLEQAIERLSQVH